MGPISRVSSSELGFRLENIHIHRCCCEVHQIAVKEVELSNNEKENPTSTSHDLLDYFYLVPFELTNINIL